MAKLPSYLAMRVPLLDLSEQYRALGDSIREAINDVLASGRFILGPKVEALERAMCAYCNTPHAIGVSSGTDALLAILMALGIGRGDAVITTPYTFFATAGCIARVGARPLFADIDRETCNIRPSAIQECIEKNCRPDAGGTWKTTSGEKLRAIVPVHLFGLCCAMEALRKIAERYRLVLIEDAAQAIGAEENGRRAGSMGLAGCFSFYPTKNLGGAGDGGLVTTSNGDFASRLKRLRTHGGFTEYEHEEIGVNSRLDALQAAVLRVKLPHLDEWSNARAQRAAIYSELLEQADLSFGLKIPVVRPNNRHIFHQYVVRVPQERDALSAHLRSHDIGTKVYYPIPLHLQRCFGFLGYKPGDFQEAERAALETMALPMFPEITDAQQEYVVNTIKNFKP